jgi:FAD/FMN-containing dehydrogenase
MFHGQLILPEDPGYDAARAVWNGMIDRRPAIIAQCSSAEDVISAVNFACGRDLCVSIKGGGHGVAGRCVGDDTVMIDLSPMKTVKVDAEKKIAHVSAGATLADLDRESQAVGLATTGGLVSETGVAGLTLGGGIGYLARRFGLTLDNLLAADVVTANGELLRASETENPDLFWGLRGGGGNFGIVTRFEYRLHKLDSDVLTAQVFYPFDAAEPVLREYRKLMSEAPDELACYALVVNVPPASPFPEEWHGKKSIALVACYTGDHEKGKRLLEPLTKLGEPILSMVAPIAYTALQQSFDAGMPKGLRYYWKAGYVDEITDEAADAFLKLAGTSPGPLTMVGFEPLGGAISRVDPSATAFAHRGVKFALGIWSGWTDPADDDKNIAWTRQFHKAMEPHTVDGVYLNYLDDDDDSRVGSVHGDNYRRLREVKAKYDPDNFFRMNHNIEPKK